MAKELHIKIDKQIGGLFIDDSGWLSAGYSANELEYALSEMPNPKRLIIHASSPGGDIEQGFKIYNRLLDLRNSGTEIHVINEAKAYSIMTFIAMAASPGKLFARKASMWCVHKPMVFVDYSLLNADELRKSASELDSFESIIVDAYVSRTNMAAKEVQAYLREDKIINSDEALEQGWIDAIIDNEEKTETELQSARMVAWKPVAFLPTKQKEEMALNETEKQGLFEQFKSWLTPVNNKDDNTDNQADTEKEELKAKIAELEPKAQELESVKSELETIKTELETLKPKATEVETKQAELDEATQKLTELQTQFDNLKNFVPGSGDNSPKPVQQFANYNKGKENNNPFTQMEENAKRLKRK